MKISWTESKTEKSRISVDDGVITSYAADLPKQYTLRDIAQSYAITYDHNGGDEVVVAEIEDLEEGDTRRFSFQQGMMIAWEEAR
jgi:hypothetical protein